MEYALLGFFTGLSLILAIGAQNIFVIEQGLKKQHVFLVCLICSISDLILIFLGIFLFHYFNQLFNQTVELILNILLILFLLHFIYSKIKTFTTLIKKQVQADETMQQAGQGVKTLYADAYRWLENNIARGKCK